MDQAPGGARSAADRVAYRILTDIRTGQYKAGDRLPTEPELAHSFGVGRTSIREGIGQLRMLGIVEVRRGIGTFVRPRETDEAQVAFDQWNAKNHYQILDLFEVRMSLEATAAALAAQRANAEVVARLEEAARAHLGAHDSGDLEDLVTTDQAFHALLVASSENQALHTVYADLVPQLVDYRRKSLALEGAPRRSGDGHLAIVEAIRQRNPLSARAAALEHLAVLYREVLYSGQLRFSEGEGRDPIPVL
jgi:DNA-binding FadR family transcriptional regulator